ncbi:DUF484 family protein [Oleiagrimonas soli]|uniref:DUF484 family protein n=1 Tax=Oleiagrimonas soli TaxID=1543381 RepID=A0A099CYZ8_9GAMM|nr:DUF484 family protein [Oleiagrimonas soli]KGI79208.1 hypothetical protein LF63_0100595 [Oleiagrimonas soli]MBB6184776.1 hypothetical protein [Oleiagrimonas soli]
MAEMTLKDGLQAMDIAEYLRKHPQFLKDFPDLAMSLTVPREHGPAASLASYQLDVLRGKNRDLERRLADLIEIAAENEQLMVRVHSLTLGLVRASSLADSARRVVAGLTEDFDTDLVRLVLLREHEGLPQADWLLVEAGGAAALPAFAEFFARKDPMVGRLASEKLDYLFGEQADSVQSAALMRLGEHGMLAIGSHDANRFHPGMGAVFLKLIAESVTAAIQRYAD